MMRVARTVLAFVVSVMLIGNLSADEKKPRPEGKHPHHLRMERGEMMIPMEMLKELNLSEEQKAKLEALKKEYGPKVKECREKAACILTEEQKQARQEAVKSAKEAGKEREEVWKEAQAAVKITDEQKAKMDEARKEGQALRKEVREKVMEILTPEQKAQLKKQREHRRDPMKPKEPEEK